MIIKLKFIIIHYNYHNSNFHHIGIITWSFEITLSDHVCTWDFSNQPGKHRNLISNLAEILDLLWGNSFLLYFVCDKLVIIFIFRWYLEKNHSQFWVNPPFTLKNIWLLIHNYFGGNKWLSLFLNSYLLDKRVQV